jgi:hypothetical protein
MEKKNKEEADIQTTVKYNGKQYVVMYDESDSLEVVSFNADGEARVRTFVPAKED